MTMLALDAGGTTFKCALIKEGHIQDRAAIPTTDPETTIAACCDFFRAAQAQWGKASRLGIGSFGPLDRQRGQILTTPKLGWAGVEMRKRFETALGCAVAIDTDVNAALLAEAEAGAAQGMEAAAYLTVGTGIGAGFMVGGRLLGGHDHPEFGHISIQRHPEDNFEGLCPLHGDCLEGMASAPALMARYGDLTHLSSESPAWPLAAFYLAQACYTVLLTFRPQRILLGGGVMQSPYLLPEIWHAFETLNADYLPLSENDILTLIQRPAFGADAGLRGAFHLARSIKKDRPSGL